MKVKFKNGTEVSVIGLIEQKMGRDLGWIMTFGITSQLTNSEVENLLTEDNISLLEVVGEQGEIKTIEGYNTVSVVTVRYQDDITTVTDVQLRK